jgi:hypothetical protein
VSLETMSLETVSLSKNEVHQQEDYTC